MNPQPKFPSSDLGRCLLGHRRYNHRQGDPVTGRIEKTVFISYRRNSSLSTMQPTFSSSQKRTRHKTPLPSPPRGRSPDLASNKAHPWKTVTAINQPAPFPFGKGGGIGPTDTPINRHNQGEVLTPRIEKSAFISYRLE